MLGSPYPMFVWWGKEMIMFHNDAYVPVLGKRHPEALGKSGPVIWADVWEFIGPLMNDVLYNGKAYYFEKQLLIPERKGFKEETYFTFSYSPIPADDSGIGGIFCVCSEDTSQVLHARRFATLTKLSQMVATDRTNEVFENAAAILEASTNDLPFGLFYALSVEGRTAELAGIFGLPQDEQIAPLTISAKPGEDTAWPIFDVKSEENTLVIVDDLQKRFPPLPAHPWDEPVRRAAIIPLLKPADNQPAGYFIAGLSPRLELDQEYKAFLLLVAGQVTTALANAITRHQEAERIKKLVALDKAKTDFFSNVSHEFRTPLTLILGPIREILSSQKDSAVGKELKTVYENILRLLKLVNTLLDFSRIEAKSMEASYEPVDLSLLTRGLASQFSSAIEKAGLTYIIDCRPLSEPVYVDVSLWEKIVLNLISNAFKFTFEGKITVALTETAKHAVLTVQDSGVGIPEKELP